MQYIVGPKNPDTDSISSALSYAALKKALGEEAVACRLGPLSEETKFATKYFDIEAPMYIDDARSRVKEIVLDKAVTVKENTTCNEAINKAMCNNSRTLCVVDDEERLTGIISSSDMLSIRMMNKASKEELLTASDINAFARDCGGIIVNKSDRISNGKVFVYNQQHFKNEYENAIVLVNSEMMVLDCIHENPALIIYASNEIDDVLSMIVKQKDISLIKTKISIEDVLELIHESIPVSLLMSRNIVSINENEYMEDVSRRLLQTRYRSYPVVNDEKKLVGMISRWHCSNYQKKEFVLVDHSSRTQTIDNIEFAEIVEVIDHHHIGGISTNKPIYYRNQIVGCTCTIIYELYKENDAAVEPKIAGMMLSAIISDTLNFKSKTTTRKDIKAARELADIAGVNLEEYAMKLLSASVNLKTEDFQKLMESDLKNYVFNNYKVAVGQTNYMDISQIQIHIDDYKKKISDYQINNKYDLLIMMFTSVKGDGTMFMFYGPKSEIMGEIIEETFDFNSGFDKKIISRKQQLVPILSKKLSEY